MNCFIPFQNSVSLLQTSEKFLYPFYYEPLSVAKQASEELMAFLSGEQAKKTIFKEGRSRMFGVLVVETELKQLGFLAAYSGNGLSKDLPYPFVPVIHDFFDEDSAYLSMLELYKKWEKEKFEILHSNEYHNVKNNVKKSEQALFSFVLEEKAKQKSEKSERDRVRNSCLNELEKNRVKIDLALQSKELHIEFKKRKKELKNALEETCIALDQYKNRISEIEKMMKLQSDSMLEYIQNGYQFLNARGQLASLLELFANHQEGKPPSGAGDCAAPRLFQYAFQNKLKPIALAEFWWESEEKVELRYHKQYYPACRGKCLPILQHMLQGIEVDKPRLRSDFDSQIKLRVIYQDQELLVIHKPEGLPSVRGTQGLISVQEILEMEYREEFIPYLIHRLDMDTSGILLIAKNKEFYISMQQLFARKKVKKRYLALVDGIVKKESGIINLPLTADIENRPRQKVDHELGKKAETIWKKVKVKDKKTVVQLFPTTGRTHQLRVHCAHSEGLGLSILGDDLYGKAADRLYLHAEYIGFFHPFHQNWMEFESKISFLKTYE